MNENNWLTWAKRLQSIVQAGLAYSKDKYDIERFQEIRDIAADIVSNHTELDIGIVKGLFCNESGYQTPKVDVRAVVIKEQKILLVKESNDGRWTLPGGWADVGLTLRENVAKEMKEETGMDVEPKRILAILDACRRNNMQNPYGIYKVFIQCELLGGSFAPNIETLECSFYNADHLPELSERRTTAEQIQLCMKLASMPALDVVFD